MNNVHVSNIKTIEMTTMNEWIKNFSFYFVEKTHVFHSKFIIQHRYRIACFSLSKSFPFNQIAGMSVKEYFISMDNDFVKNCIHPAHIHTHTHTVVQVSKTGTRNTNTENDEYKFKKFQ